ncbi:MAG: putative porin [Cellvibrionaceae bacterium]|nr:putative porin [Cellvibrionaceae bacterium]
MLKKVALLAALTAVAFPVSAENYKTEITGEFENVDANTSQQRLTAGVRYHFLEVLAARRPYAEAAFLQRSSNVWATHTELDADNFDARVLNVGADFFVPESVFFVAGGVTRFESDDDDDTTWRVTGGVLPVDGLLVTTTYVENIDYDLNLDLKYVTRMFTGRYLNLTANYSNGDEDDNYGFGVDYYLDRATSFGVSAQSEGDNSSFGVRARHFFTPLAFGAASFSSGDEVDTIKIEGGFRF